MICSGCGVELSRSEYVIKWDEHGYGYSTKLGCCPCCGKVLQILCYRYDRGFDGEYDYIREDD